MEPGKRLAVFSIRKVKSGSVWVRAGTAFVNKDQSLNVYLDVLPLDGQLHLREPMDRREAADKPESQAALPAYEPAAMQSSGGH